MTQPTKQEKLGLIIANAINSLPDSGNNFKDCFTLAQVILDAGYTEQSFEPLEVYIKKIKDNEFIIDITDSGKKNNLAWFKSENEAIDFCTKHGLRVKE